MKYRLIKPISVIALRREPEVGDVELLSAIDEFGSTIYCNTPCEAPQKLIEYCERTSCRIRALIRMGYLEEIKEEVTYHIGQRLERRGEEYIISRREDRETMHLTCLEDGNIWSRIRCDVINTRRITQEEFNVMTNNKSNEFTPIEDT